MIRLKIIPSNTLLDSSLTRWRSDSKTGVQTRRIVYHINCGRHNYGEKDRDRRELHPPHTHNGSWSKWLFAYVSAPSEHKQQNSKSARGSEGWYLLSINCNWCLVHSVTISHISPTPAPPPAGPCHPTHSAHVMCCHWADTLCCRTPWPPQCTVWLQKGPDPLWYFQNNIHTHGYA